MSDAMYELRMSATRPFTSMSEEGFSRAIADVKADAWDQAIRSLSYPDGSSVEVMHNGNPYRTEAQ